jgi:hypothetical protein
MSIANESIGKQRVSKERIGKRTVVKRSIGKERFSPAVDGEVQNQLLSGEAVVLATPPSCAAGSISPGQMVWAIARNGANGTDGAWEYAINGMASGPDGQYAWGGTAGAPFSSSQVPLDFVVDLTGTAGSYVSLSVGTGLPVSQTLAPFTRITSVGVRAEVWRYASNPSITARAEWSSLNITFFDNLDNGYQYPEQALQACPMPFTAQTPSAPSTGMTYQTRIIQPGAVAGATYPVRMSLNGTFQLSASAPAETLLAQQICVKVYVWAI